MRQTRLKLLLEWVNGQAMMLLIDETGNCKKGNSTDYVKRQYIGNVGKKENGIVPTAYGLFQGMILPLCFEVYKPKERLKAGEDYQSKPLTRTFSNGDSKESLITNRLSAGGRLS